MDKTTHIKKVKPQASSETKPILKKLGPCAPIS